MTHPELPDVSPRALALGALAVTAALVVAVATLGSSPRVEAQPLDDAPPGVPGTEP